MRSTPGEMGVAAGRGATGMLKLFKGEPAISIEHYRGHASFLPELAPLLHF